MKHKFNVENSGWMNAVRFIFVLIGIISIIIISVLVSLVVRRNNNTTMTDTVYIQDTLYIDSNDEYLYPDDTDTLLWFYAITELETGSDSSAVSENGKYVGPAQIGMCVVNEINRLVRYEKYTDKDRYTWNGSYNIFRDYVILKNAPLTADGIRSIWNPKAGSWYAEYLQNIYDCITEY